MDCIIKEQECHSINKILHHSSVALHTFINEMQKLHIGSNLHNELITISNKMAEVCIMLDNERKKIQHDNFEKE